MQCSRNGNIDRSRTFFGSPILPSIFILNAWDEVMTRRYDPIMIRKYYFSLQMHKQRGLCLGISEVNRCEVPTFYHLEKLQVRFYYRVSKLVGLKTCKFENIFYILTNYILFKINFKNVIYLPDQCCTKFTFNVFSPGIILSSTEVYWHCADMFLNPQLYVDHVEAGEGK